MQFACIVVYSTDSWITGFGVWGIRLRLWSFMVELRLPDFRGYSGVLSEMGVRGRFCYLVFFFGV